MKRLLILFVSAAITAAAFAQLGDMPVKTDVTPLEDVAPRLSEIIPVSYRLVYPSSGVSQSISENVASAKLQYGFLAQNVREVYPDLVYEFSNGNVGLDFNGFIPILVAALQNLQKTVAEQGALIAALQNQLKINPVGEDSAVLASLGQNSPNPFNVSTEIKCTIPEDATNAYLCVYDLNGSQKMRRDITERGNVTVTIEGNRLTAGMYIYTLIIDGNETGWKRMTLTD